MTTDPLYLDGSQPYHRHGERVLRGADCKAVGDAPAEATPVIVFDPDALSAHDEAIRQAADQGTTQAPLYRDDQWEFALLEPVEPGQEPTDARVMAGWTPGGEFLRYVTPECLCAAFRQTIENSR